jgi:hypothetical protein
VLDDEPVADELDGRRVDELLRPGQRDRRLAALDRLDVDVAGGDPDLQPDGPGSGEGLLFHRDSFQLRP